MAGGIHTLPYARFAAECLWKKCPEPLRKDLNVIIGLFAVPTPLVSQAETFLKKVPCVSILLDPVWVPLRIFSLPPGYARHRIGKVLKLIRLSLERLGLPPGVQIRLCPVVYGHLGLYHQEYFVRICQMESERETICIVDADFFIWDEDFFNKLSIKQSEDTFASGWLQRHGCGITFNEQTCFPAGTECLRLKPKMFNVFNWQAVSMDETLQKRLAGRYPSIRFQQRGVDTIYQACWEAQLAGRKIDYPFKEMKVCHVGGFGHANASYIRDCLERNAIEGEGGAQFWIQRIRLNERVAKVLGQRYHENWIGPGLEKVRQRTRPIWEDEIIRTLEKRTPPSNDEILFEEIVAGLRD
ncbi:MAG: hypothetical protein ACLQSR_07205 [Limisphaerales bacterium]